MEHNSRTILPIVYQDEKGSLIYYKNILDAFFPFDPYVLKRSSTKITPFYLNYQGNIEDGESDSKRSYEMDDDFIGEDPKPDRVGCKKAKFSYGTSPGFKQ